MISPLENRMKHTLIFSALFFAVASSSAFAKEGDADKAAPVAAKCPALQASTVFVSDKGQKGSAEKLTQAHKNAESQGWNFDEMSLYTEDGDLKGFYVTYTRPHPCNDQSAE
jgi:hypothetical protein